jgi:PAS domain S-box-containing protein
MAKNLAAPIVLPPTKSQVEQPAHLNSFFLNTLIETIPSPIFYKDRNGIYTGCNRAFEEFIGHTRDQIIGKHVGEMGPPEITEKYRIKDDELFASPGTQTYEWRVKRSDGEIRDVIFNKATFENHDGQVDGMVGVIVDITEHRKLEREIINISSREQQHFGHTLHDTLAQILTGIAFQAKALSTALNASSGSPDKNKSIAHQIARLANEALSQSRRIAHGLSPVAMTEEGLSAALDELAEGTAELYGVQCDFVAPRPAAVYDNETATHLYYIAREAVSNAMRHGKATMVRIQLEVDGDWGTLSIINNGKNMPENGSENKDMGMGIRIMRYRAEVVHGNLKIGPAPNSRTGVAVTCRFPNRE